MTAYILLQGSIIFPVGLALNSNIRVLTLPVSFWLHLVMDNLLYFVFSGLRPTETQSPLEVSHVYVLATGI